MIRRHRHAIAFILAISLSVACSGSPGYEPPIDEQGPAPISTVPISYSAPPPASCHARGPLPDPICTPGKTNPAVTQATINTTICMSGWTSTVRPGRNVTDPVKTERLIAYGMPQSVRGRTELDHFLPLELGGATGAEPGDIANLWPEDSIPIPGFHEKDKVENYLHEMVCGKRDGKGNYTVQPSMTLAAAQQAILSDWTVIYRQLTG